MSQRALLSVSDKTGLLPFAAGLIELGFELLSTGGTLSALLSAGLKATSVESYTGSPEVMDGRVKTLHPKIHGGLLARGAVDSADLEKLGAFPIDLVVVNLYPFAATLAKAGSSFQELIENIDIGGPSMLRSAAKNHNRVTAVCDPSDYPKVLAELRESGQTSLSTRRALAAKVFKETAIYDGLIAEYLSSVPAETAPSDAPPRDPYPGFMSLPMERVYTLRYGENPHQTGAFYRDINAPSGSLARSVSLGTGAKELSFNNLVDIEAALEAVREFQTPAAVIVKHANPCGVAIGADLEAAYRRARAADETSAFGGIVALNGSVDPKTAAALVETFLECVIAPDFTEESLSILRTKKNLRVLMTGAWLGADHADRTMKRVGGGMVIQDRDRTGAGDFERITVATKRAPTEAEWSALRFGWLVCKHVKSNAIVLSGSDQTYGIGAGQMSRVESVRIACRKAGDLARGAALASDAFFPFPDGVALALEHGVTAFVQPGGSVKDAEVIETADRAGATMVMTGVRHFRH